MAHQSVILKLGAVETLTEAEKSAAMSLCTDIQLAPRRHVIISRGERPRYVRVVLEGWAARYSIQRDGSRRITAFLIPGDFCDLHVATLDRMDHGIIAISDCTLGCIAASAIEAITRSTPALTRAFWRSTLVDEAILRQWLVNAGRADAYTKVGHLLCELHQRAKLVGLARDGVVAVPLTQEDLADATGLTSVHVNRMLRRLREDGFVTLRGGEMHIRDIDGLRRVADFDPGYLHLQKRTPGPDDSAPTGSTPPPPRG